MKEDKIKYSHIYQNIILKHENEYLQRLDELVSKIEKKQKKKILARIIDGEIRQNTGNLLKLYDKANLLQEKLCQLAYYLAVSGLINGQYEGY